MCQAQQSRLAGPHILFGSAKFTLVYQFTICVCDFAFFSIKSTKFAFHDTVISYSSKLPATSKTHDILWVILGFQGFEKANIIPKYSLKWGALNRVISV
jgi:hypothetical protein